MNHLEALRLSADGELFISDRYRRSSTQNNRASLEHSRRAQHHRDDRFNDNITNNMQTSEVLSDMNTPANENSSQLEKQSDNLHRSKRQVVNNKEENTKSMKKLTKDDIAIPKSIHQNEDSSIEHKSTRQNDIKPAAQEIKNKDLSNEELEAQQALMKEKLEKEIEEKLEEKLKSTLKKEMDEHLKTQLTMQETLQNKMDEFASKERKLEEDRQKFEEFKKNEEKQRQDEIKRLKLEEIEKSKKSISPNDGSSANSHKKEVLKESLETQIKLQETEAENIRLTEEVKRMALEKEIELVRLRAEQQEREIKYLKEREEERLKAEQDRIEQKKRDEETAVRLKKEKEEIKQKLQLEKKLKEEYEDNLKKIEKQNKLDEIARMVKIIRLQTTLAIKYRYLKKNGLLKCQANRGGRKTVAQVLYRGIIYTSIGKCLVEIIKTPGKNPAIQCFGIDYKKMYKNHSIEEKIVNKMISENKFDELTSNDFLISDESIVLKSENTNPNLEGRADLIPNPENVENKDSTIMENYNSSNLERWESLQGSKMNSQNNYLIKVIEDKHEDHANVEQSLRVPKNHNEDSEEDSLKEDDYIPEQSYQLEQQNIDAEKVNNTHSINDKIHQNSEDKEKKENGQVDQKNDDSVPYYSEIVQFKREIPEADKAVYFGVITQVDRLIEVSKQGEEVDESLTKSLKPHRIDSKYLDMDFEFFGKNQL